MMVRSKKLFVYKLIALAFVVFLFLTSSVNPSPDMDMRVIATTIGLDYSGDNVYISAQLISPIAEGGGNSITSVAEGNGKTLSEAIGDMSIGLGKKIEYEQCSMVVVGEAFARLGLYEPLSYLISSGLVRTGTNLLYSENKTAKEFIAGVTQLNKDSSIGLNEFLMYSREDVNISTVSILEFLSNSMSASRGAYIPCLSYVKNEAGETTAQVGAIEQANTIAIFGDCIYVKTLSIDEASGVSWLDKNIKKGDVVLENFSYENVNYGAVSLELENKKVKLKTFFNGDEPMLMVNIKTKMRIKDKHLLDKTTTDVAFCVALEREFESKIRAEIDKTIAMGRLYNTDFIKIKTQFHRFNLAELRKNNLTYDKIFHNMTVNYTIKCDIK